MLGALFALISAASFGFNNAAMRRGVLTGGVLQAMVITVPIGVPLFALASYLFGGFDSLQTFSGETWLWMIGAGVIHFVIGRYGNYRATRALGATLSAPIQQMTVPISLILAVMLLDESLTPLRFLGFVLIMIGPAIMMGKKGERARSGFMPNYPEGIFWGLVCAVGYGASPIFIAMGLGAASSSLPDSLAGGFISYLAAAIVVLALAMGAGGWKMMTALDPTAARWFLLSGVFVFISQMFRYMSLAVAPVSVVVPIQRLSAVFRIFFAWLLNRDHEIINRRVLIGFAVSFSGAMALSLSTEFVVAFLPPEWQHWLTISWP